MPSASMRFRAPSVALAALAPMLFIPSAARAQAPQDPAAVAFINQGLALLNGGTALSDVTLQATVTYTSGSDVETGTGTLQALGDENSLVVLNLTNGQAEYILNTAGGWPAGAWLGTDGSVNMYGFQNCWSDGAWFFPGLIFTSLPGNPQVALVNMGQGTWNGSTTDQVQLYQVVTSQGTGMSALIQGFSVETVYLDPNSSLPLAIDFNLYSDQNSSIELSGEIQFSNYQTVNGMSVPLHVQRLVNGSVILDVTVTSVTVNSGLPASLFNIP
jgi:hypothetical protein